MIVCVCALRECPAALTVVDSAEVRDNCNCSRFNSLASV